MQPVSQPVPFAPLSPSSHPHDNHALRETALVHVDDPQVVAAIRMLGALFVEMSQEWPHFPERNDSHMAAQLAAVVAELRYLAGYLLMDVAKGGTDRRLSRRRVTRIRKQVPGWVDRLATLAAEIEATTAGTAPQR
jgi:hypothetical protein